MSAYDVAIIGGGVVGASAAWFLASDGARVVLLEREAIAAGASGRNSGAIQHPFDPLPAELYQQTIEIYREVARAGVGFELAPRPAGLLLLSRDEDAVRAETAAVTAAAPQLEAQFLAPADLRRLEPGLADGLSACRLETGYPVEPAAATLAFARLAQQAGAEFRVGQAAEPNIRGERAVGVRLASGQHIDSGQVLLAAGPWTSALVPAWREVPPITELWGVVVTVELAQPPGHVLEELGIGGGLLPRLFSLVTAAGQSGVGSVFAADRPEPHVVADEILRRGSEFVPQLASTQPVGLRACARPASADRRPAVGPLPGVEDLFVCAGHGPWGISTGPATARLVAQLMRADGATGPSVPDELSPARFDH